MNRLLYYCGRFIAWIYLRILYRVKVYGIEHIPERKPFIICSNHINWADPLIIGTSIPARYRIHFMAKSELFGNFITNFFFRSCRAFPVKRDTTNIAAIKTAYKLLNEGQVIGLFPEGSRSKNGSLQDKLRNGAALIAVRSGVPILPVAVSGSYRPFKEVHLHIGAPFVLPPLVYENGEEKKAQLKKMSQVILHKIGRLLPDYNLE